MLGQENHKKKKIPTKLIRPRMHAVYPRKRIFSAIAASETCGSLWVGAPAGSGKTTVVNSYLKGCDLPCLWYTLDEGDADIATFFFYLRTAAAILFPQEEALPPFFTADSFFNISLFAKRFFEKFFSLFSTPVALVLDDYQEAEGNLLLREVLGSAIDQLPEHIRLYILSRGEPPPELVRQQVSQRLALLGWEDLRLKLNETRCIAQAIKGLETTKEVLADLHAKTDGWVTGLLLLLKRGESNGISPQLLSRHTPQEIFDYLSEESFKKLAPEIKHILLRLAFLQRITVAGSNFIVRGVDADEVLQRLQRGNTFLSLMAGEEVAYRFHPLMRHFLQIKARQMMTAEELKQLLQDSAAVMAEEGDLEEAIRLYRSIKNIPAAVELLLSEAFDLARQGRFDTLEKLITELPKAVYTNDPWLIYWRAACRLPFAAGSERDLFAHDSLLTLFGKALAHFEATEDSLGCYLALAGILEAIWLDMDDFKLLDSWIAKYDELSKRWNPFEASEAMPWLTPAILSALQVRNPVHPGFAEWFQTGMGILLTTKDATVAIRIYIPIVLQHLLMGNLLEAGHLIQRFQAIFHETISPASAIVFHYESAFYYWLSGRFDACLKATNRAFEIAQTYSGRTMYAQVHGTVAALSLGDMKLGERFLRRAEGAMSAYGAWEQALVHVVAGWMAMVKKNFHQVRINAFKGLRTGKKVGNPATLPLHYLHCALSCFSDGERKYAKTYLDDALEHASRFQTKQIEFGCHLARAEFALAEEEEDELSQALRDAFGLGSMYDYVITYFWRMDVMARLCAEALERDIEPDYAVRLIRFHKLAPTASSWQSEKWPWPIRICLLGRFAVEIDGTPVAFVGKGQLKPLALLKCLLAKGGRDVIVSNLRDDLWPEADGDRAVFAFKAALHRLRKLLGTAQTVKVGSGRISLNANLCWTDLWAFDDLCGNVETALAEDSSNSNLRQWSRRLLNFYQGPFLQDEEAHWAIHVRKDLANRFSDLMNRCAIRLVQQGQIEPAITLLQQAVRAEPAADSLCSLLQRCRKNEEEM